MFAVYGAGNCLQTNGFQNSICIEIIVFRGPPSAVCGPPSAVRRAGLGSGLNNVNASDKNRESRPNSGHYEKPRTVAQVYGWLLLCLFFKIRLVSKLIASI